jgi:hypothetical protein
MKNLALFALAPFALAAHGANSCQATSPAVPPTVVELYTSEGCSSCPPADRWLSTLKGRSDVLPLAFHVNYWDRLGWVDRYASPEATSRQYELARLAGQSGVYTPQVIAAGKDWRVWPKLPAAKASAAPALKLEREGDRVQLTIAATSNATSPKLAGYWAVTEDGHQSRVAAGENAGETLRHDHVVRLYKPLPAFAAAQGQRAELAITRGVPEHPRRVVFVLTDATTQRPLQAVALGC